MRRWASVAVVAVLLAACATTACRGRRSPSGFQLPEGSPEAGKRAFVELQCSNCHTVKNANLPAPQMNPPVALGGMRALPPTDGEITTDIILPSSHFARGYPASQVQEGAKSKMPDYSSRITIRQLADLVAFLRNSYGR